MQNDQNETKLHNKYDYECIRNTLSLIHYFPGKHVLAFNVPWSALKSKQHICVEFLLLGGGVLRQLFWGEGSIFFSDDKYFLLLLVNKPINFHWSTIAKHCTFPV